MNMRDYSTLHLDIFSSKETAFVLLFFLPGMDRLVYAVLHHNSNILSLISNWYSLENYTNSHISKVY